MGHQTCWGKIKERRRGVSMPPQLCPSCSSLNAFPVHCPHLLSGRFLSSFKTHCSHVTCSMESSLTSRTGGPFHKLPEAPSLPSIILYCPRLLLCLTPHFNWGQEQACHSPGCPVSDLGPQQARVSTEQMRGKWPGGQKAPGEAKTPAWPQVTDQQPRPGPGGLLALFSSPLCPQL